MTLEALLKDTILLISRSHVHYSSTLTINALITVAADEEDAQVISIHEYVESKSHNSCILPEDFDGPEFSSITSQYANESNSTESLVTDDELSKSANKTDTLISNDSMDVNGKESVANEESYKSSIQLEQENCNNDADSVYVLPGDPVENMDASESELLSAITSGVQDSIPHHGFEYTKTSQLFTMKAVKQDTGTNTFDNEKPFKSQLSFKRYKLVQHVEQPYLSADVTKCHRLGQINVNSEADTYEPHITGDTRMQLKTLHYEKDKKPRCSYSKSSPWSSSVYFSDAEDYSHKPDKRDSAVQHLASC